MHFYAELVFEPPDKDKLALLPWEYLYRPFKVCIVHSKTEPRDISLPAMSASRLFDRLGSVLLARFV
jgi:hypothetical protein